MAGGLNVGDRKDALGGVVRINRDIQINIARGQGGDRVLSLNEFPWRQGELHLIDAGDNAVGARIQKKNILGNDPPQGVQGEFANLRPDAALRQR